MATKPVKCDLGNFSPHVPEAVHEGGDHAAEGEQGLVDLPRLAGAAGGAQAHAHCYIEETPRKHRRKCDFEEFPLSPVLGAGAGDVLRAREVDEVELAALDHLLALGGALLDVDRDREHAVGARRLLVEEGRGGVALGRAALQQGEDLGGAAVGGEGGG